MRLSDPHGMKHTLVAPLVAAFTLCVVVLASPFVAGLVAQTTPTRNAALRAVWTPASGAPKGLLTALEGRNHDSFIDRARASNIDLVFFGATDTAMWRWPDTISGGVDRGKRVWDQAFGSLNAASFGSQGTHFESLLWRMQNGELDGYQAKLVVLHGVTVGLSRPVTISSGDQLIGDRQAEFVANSARILAEIRARQPQEDSDLAALSAGSVASRGVAHGRGCERRGVQEARRRQHRLLRGYRRALFPVRRFAQQRDVDDDADASKRGDTRARVQGVGRSASAVDQSLRTVRRTRRRRFNKQHSNCSEPRTVACARGRSREQMATLRGRA